MSSHEADIALEADIVMEANIALETDNVHESISTFEAGIVPEDAEDSKWITNLINDLLLQQNPLTIL